MGFNGLRLGLSADGARSAAAAAAAAADSSSVRGDAGLCRLMGLFLAGDALLW